MSTLQTIPKFRTALALADYELIVKALVSYKNLQGVGEPKLDRQITILYLKLEAAIDKILAGEQAACSAVLGLNDRRRMPPVSAESLGLGEDSIPLPQVGMNDRDRLAAMSEEAQAAEFDKLMKENF